jgi:hypothetical protein
MSNRWITREYGPMTRAQHRQAAAFGQSGDPVAEIVDMIAYLKSKSAPKGPIAELEKWAADLKGGGSPQEAQEEQRARRARLGLSTNATPIRREGNKLVLGSMTRQQAAEHRERGAR